MRKVTIVVPVREHGDLLVDLIEDERIGLPVVPSVQPTDVLCQRSLPRDRHREKQGIKPSVVEAFAKVAAGREDQSLPSI